MKIDEHPNNFLIEKFEFVYNEINVLLINNIIINFGVKYIIDEKK